MMRRTFAFLLLLLGARAESELELCLTGLSEHIQLDRSLYRAYTTHDYDYDPRIVDSVDKAILSQVLGRVTDRENIEKNNPGRIRSNTLYAIVSSDTAYVKYLLDRTHRAMWTAHRQRILIVSNNVKPKEILEYAWSRGLVDVTFLRPSFTIIYQFNGFDKKLTRTKCSSKTAWFPEKVKDLLGYRMQVDVLDDPPLCNIGRNASGHVVEKSGAEIAIFELVAEKLNFQPQFLPRAERISFEDYRNAIFLREVNINELLTNIRLGKVEMLANARICPFEDHSGLDYSCSTTAFATEICPVVPIILRQRPIDNSFFIAAGFIASLIIADRLLVYCGNFDRKFWNFLVIIKLILGFAEEKKPKRTSEKVIYVCLIFASITYLARTFDQLTKFHLNKFEEIEFKSLTDIVKYNLQPQADSEIAPKYMEISSTDEFGKEHKVKIQQWISRLDCLRKLENHQNVTCFTSQMIGELTVSTTRKNSNKQKMKILYDCPWFGRSKIIMARGSPYARPINDILPWMGAGGIPDWLIRRDLFELNLKNNVTYENEKNDLENNQIDLLFWGNFGIAGLLIATMVFFLEIVVARYWRC